MNKNQLEVGTTLQLQFEKRGGLIPVVVQNAVDKEILMLGYINQKAFDETIDTGFATFWSTSRQELWTKGKTSGDLLRVIEIRVDCDQDAVIFIVEMQGNGVCHTTDQKGQTRPTCFYRELTAKDQLRVREGLA